MEAALLAQTANDNSIQNEGFRELNFFVSLLVTVHRSMGTVIKDSINLHVYLRPDRTLRELTSLGARWKSDRDAPIVVNLQWTRKGGESSSGAFKLTKPGVLSTDIFGTGGKRRVAVKQNFTTHSDSANHKPILLNMNDQVTKVWTEVNMVKWAIALMKLVEGFMDAKNKVSGKVPPFDVPLMGYVDMALAVAAEKPSDKKARRFVCLLEPWLDEETEGPFRKYMGNGSAIPCEMTTPKDVHRSLYLSFCQHVQYMKTKGLLFLADFQGVS